VPFRFLRRLAFRDRILLALLFLGAVPSAILSAGWVWSLLQYNPARSSRFVLDTVRVTGQHLLETLDSTRLRAQGAPGPARFTPRESLALDEHVKAINVALIRSESGFHYARLRAIGLAIGIALLGLFLVSAAVYLARSIARGLSRPTDELVGWMDKIRRHEPLPDERGESGTGSRESGAPEFAVLRAALRETAGALQQGRAAELESERLRAFREVARRVAHEMKNPLTPIRFAIGQLERSSRGAGGSAALESGKVPIEEQEALEVLRVESARLEQLAREFANLGRLPEGPAAEVDLGELLAELLKTSVPESMQPVLRVDAAAPRIIGHYDPLHRAFSNLIRNAVEASQRRGGLEVTVGIEESGDGIAGVRVMVADHGPGVAPEQQARIFEPYVTNKEGGTGLGLALVKQAIEFHRGSIEVAETPGGGATFIVRLPVTGRSRMPPIARPPFVERRVADRRRRTT
jgi:signal transduction histidine kinase